MEHTKENRELGKISKFELARDEKTFVPKFQEGEWNKIEKQEIEKMKKDIKVEERKR
jgi:hypothetical protein